MQQLFSNLAYSPSLSKGGNCASSSHCVCLFKPLFDLEFIHYQPHLINPHVQHVSFAADRSGHITVQELRQALQTRGFELPFQQISELVSLCALVCISSVWAGLLRQGEHACMCVDVCVYVCVHVHVRPC